jgi:hypothetical protein
VSAFRSLLEAGTDTHIGRVLRSEATADQRALKADAKYLTHFRLTLEVTTLSAPLVRAGELLRDLRTLKARNDEEVKCWL